MKKTALITGASSGIGLEFANVFAKERYDLVLTARREDRLNALKEKLEAEFSINVHTIACDLTQANAAQTIFSEVQSQNIIIDVLINNAGFGAFGPFSQSDLQNMTDMVQVNVTALIQMTRLFMAGMITRKQGHILNVASMAAFVPGPMMSIYFATKAFVLSFSEAIANELQGTGVNVTVLCPGPVKSEFQAVAYHEDAKTTLSRKIPTSAQTAQFGYDAMMRKDLIAITGLKNRLLPFVERILPRKMTAKIVRSAQDSHKLKKYENK